VSSRDQARLWILIAGFVLAALPAAAQYPGQITNPDKSTPRLRAVAVLEWTGDENHPKASRLIPVSVYDGKDLEDAGVYLAHPEPLALEGEVEYQLQLNGKPVGLFDVENSGEVQGSWVGFGKFRDLPKPKPANTQIAKVDEDDAQSDTPVLHRKHHAGDADGNSGSGSGSGSGAGPSGPPPDPDRPTLHKSGDASSSGSGGDAGNGTANGSGSGSGSGNGSSGSAQASDPDRPTLHKGGDASGSGPGNGAGNGAGNSDAGPAPDPDRPTLHRDDNASSGSGQSKKKKVDEDDEAYVSGVDAVTDPERPRLFRGKAEGYGGPVLPSVVGMPTDLKQEIAVSDVKSSPVHPWDYSWANPADEDKMKTGLEAIARDALGLNPPPALAKPATKSAAAHKSTKPSPPPPPPAPLVDEQFRVFELAYGAGATMVLSAHTDVAKGPVKFVTLVAQPDLYGDVTVLVKNVTDAAHLDENPRLRLVDAVDAMADNRGELLFELRGETQRQFALYRVLRGQATRIFVSGGEAIGTAAGE
jgi:hypothetical protein